MQSCSCVRARTRGGINNERYAALRSVLTWLADPTPPAADGAPIRSSPCRDRQSDSDAAKAPEARSAPVGETDRTNSDPPEHGVHSAPPRAAGYMQLCYRLRRYGCTAHAWAGGRGTAAFGSAHRPACLRAAVRGSTPRMISRRGTRGAERGTARPSTLGLVSAQGKDGWIGGSGQKLFAPVAGNDGMGALTGRHGRSSRGPLLALRAESQSHSTVL